MSVSSHLTPEPERRLWLILEKVREEAERAQWKAAALGGLSALELALGGAPFPGAARAALAAAAALGALALLPDARKGRRLPLLDPTIGRQTVDDSLISVEDIPKYAYGELVLKLDRYLGGGVTSHQYYEDIIADIGRQARRAGRARRLLAVGAAFSIAAHLALAASFVLR